MQISHLHFKDHELFINLRLDFFNKKTKKPYSIVAFVGENGCGKTMLLNEIFNYNISQSIVNKETPFGTEFNSLYLRQGSLYRNTINEAIELLDGKKIYSTNSVLYNGGLNVYNLRANNTINNINECLEILKQLNDSDIIDVVKNNRLDDLRCGREVTSIIKRLNFEYDLTKYSSGQQEILLKLRDIKNMSAGTDCVLIDEPETSLHPRWQREIIKLLSLMMSDSDGNVPQMFIATHSEKILESLLDREDALIVRLYKENETVKAESIDQMNLLLPKPTFAEMDYLIFNIPLVEYQNQLFAYIGSLTNKERILDIDKEIKKQSIKLFGESNIDQYIKVRIYHKSKYEMLPTYIRNYSHHPEGVDCPTNEELEISINLLRKIIENLKA